MHPPCSELRKRAQSWHFSDRWRAHSSQPRSFDLSLCWRMAKLRIYCTMMIKYWWIFLAQTQKSLFLVTFLLTLSFFYNVRITSSDICIYLKSLGFRKQLSWNTVYTTFSSDFYAQPSPLMELSDVCSEFWLEYSRPNLWMEAQLPYLNDRG